MFDMSFSCRKEFELHHRSVQNKRIKRCVIYTIRTKHIQIIISHVAFRLVIRDVISTKKKLFCSPDHMHKKLTCISAGFWTLFKLEVVMILSSLLMTVAYTLYLRLGILMAQQCFISCHCWFGKERLTLLVLSLF